MPPRLNKRQLREQEELLALEAAKRDAPSGEETTQDVFASPMPIGQGFSALISATETDEGDSEDITASASKSKKHKKKKKKPTAVASPTPSGLYVEGSNILVPQTESTVAGPSKKEKKALKKQKAKEKKDDRDEVDKALAELSVKYPDLQQHVASPANISPAARSASNALSSLLSVSLQHLDSEAEMRKFFGAKVISAAKTSASGSSSPSTRQSAVQRSNLTRPQPTWWPATKREGLSIRALTDDEIEQMQIRHGWDTLHGEKLWTVEYSKKYRGATYAFIQTVMSGDPEGFWQLLRYLPYHADTLLQLSEVYFHREEHSTAADFIDRALFTYERAFLGAFNFTSGQNRLDFDRVENRPFFLAIHRQITDLQRRGCVRTAFEFARLLYALDPWTDPHGALLHLDFLAVKAGMGHWLLKVWDLFARQGEKVYAGRLQVTALPGWAYARSLALHANEEANGEVHDASTKALREAILEFPSVVPLLADKADITLSPDVRAQKMFRIHVDSSSVSTEAESILHLLSHLYAQRSFSLWKAPARSSWFAQTVTSVISSLKSPSDHSASYALFTALFSKPALAYSVYRHAIVNESSCRRLFSFIPRSVTNTKHLACDPLPPPTRVNEYNAEFFKGAEDALMARPRGRRANERMLERLLPDPVFRGQLQAFFEAHPHFAQRFPGGILQFAQIAGQLPEDVLEDMMIAEAGIAEQEGRGAMPGQMPGHEMLFADFTDDEDEGDLVEEDGPALPPPVADENEDGEAEEEEEEVAPLPLRFLRTIMNRFWGGGAAATGETSEDDDDDAPPASPRDTNGVD